MPETKQNQSVHFDTRWTVDKIQSGPLHGRRRRYLGNRGDQVRDRWVGEHRQPRGLPCAIIPRI